AFLAEAQCLAAPAECQAKALGKGRGHGRHPRKLAPKALQCYRWSTYRFPSKGLVMRLKIRAKLWITTGLLMWPLSAAIASATQHQANPPHSGRVASEAQPILPNGEDAPLSPSDADSMPRIDWAEIALSNSLQRWLGMWEEGQVGDWLTVAFSQVGPLQMQLSSLVASDKPDDERLPGHKEFPVPERMFNMRVSHAESGELVMSWRHVIDCHLRKYQL